MTKSMGQRLGLAAIGVAAGAVGVVGIAAPASAAPALHHTNPAHHPGIAVGDRGHDHDHGGPGRDHDGPGRDHDGPGRDHDGSGRDHDGPGLPGHPGRPGRPGGPIGLPGHTRCDAHVNRDHRSATATCFNVPAHSAVTLSIQCRTFHGTRIERTRRFTFQPQRVLVVNGRCGFGEHAIDAWAS